MPRILSNEQTRLVRDDMGRRKPAKRGSRRAAKNLGQNMERFWQMNAEDRRIIHEISKVGRYR